MQKPEFSLFEGEAYVRTKSLDKNAFLRSENIILIIV